MISLKFLGATGTVTGSTYLLTSGTHEILVDCGLFQGHKELRLRHRHPFPVAPAAIDAVVLTHAHLDHGGYLPLLVNNGFTGMIFRSAATVDLCKILLPGSGHLQDEEANDANGHGFSKHAPALPLYSEAGPVQALRQAARPGRSAAPDWQDHPRHRRPGQRHHHPLVRGRARAVAAVRHPSPEAARRDPRPSARLSEQPDGGRCDRAVPEAPAQPSSQP